MKRLSFFLFLTGCLLGSNGVIAQDTSVIVQPDAFYYALPENYFEVKVKVQIETFYKGPLADYAGEITGLSSTVKENKVQYKILSIAVKEYARADKNQLYKLKKTCKKHHFNFLHSGLLSMERKNSTTSPNPSEGGEFVLPKEGQGAVNRFAIYSADAVMEKYDTTYTYEEFDSVLVQVPHIARSLVIKPTKQQAEDAMEKLEKIRESRWLLISGDHEIDFSQLSIMLAELQKMENDYLTLFSGMLETAEKEYTFIVCPTQKADIFSTPLFRFSTADGITEKEIGTVSYSLNFKSLDSQNELIKKITADAEKQKKKIDSSGKTVYYRLPQIYTVALLENGKQSQAFGEYPVAQLGEVLSLPKKVKRFQLDPFTGGLKSVKF
jgi:hypothetical protein